MDIKNHNVKVAIEKFPTNLDRLLHKKSYFWIVYERLLDATNFLEIGYRKGLFVEVCRALGINSVHVDITDELLKASSSENNQCITKNSISYLKHCTDQFDLIFQDGSKEYKDRIREYDLIMKKSLLTEDGIILVDDIHYKGCDKAFKEAAKKYGFTSQIFPVFDKHKYSMGLLKKNSEEE